MRPTTRASTAKHNHTGTIASRMSREGAISPATSTAATSTTATRKRKERDFESDAARGANFINVVVRCRGRNEQEVRENTNVVVATEGIKGKQVEVSMGLNALRHKTYNFDRVRSSWEAEPG
jgi:kinesin family protein 11